MLQLSVVTPVAFETNLIQLVENARATNENTILIHCGSTVTNYILSRPEHRRRLDGVPIHRVHSAEELLMLLRSKEWQQKITQAHFLVVTPYYHLLENDSLWKQKKMLLRIENALEKIEKGGNVHVVCAREE